MFRHLGKTLNNLSNWKGVHQQLRLISAKTVNVTVSDNGIATVTMHRPCVNALNFGLLNELHQAFEEIENMKATAVILTSAHKKVFCAGLDFPTLYEPQFDEFKIFWTALQDAWLKIYSFNLPTVAVINGHSPAGGCLLAMACEYRIMVKDYIIGLNETKLGMVPPEWLIMNMKEIMGNRHTELALTSGTLFTTEQAFSVGLIDDIAIDKDDAISKTQNFFTGFAKTHLLARHMTKTSVRRENIEFLIENKDEDCLIFYDCLIKPYVQKAIATFIK